VFERSSEARAIRGNDEPFERSVNSVARSASGVRKLDVMGGMLPRGKDQLRNLVQQEEKWISSMESASWPYWSGCDGTPAEGTDHICQGVEDEPRSVGI
jgi:hypothetical protein